MKLHVMFIYMWKINPSPMMIIDLNKLCKLKSLVLDNNEELKVIPGLVFDNVNLQILGLHGYVYGIL